MAICSSFLCPGDATIWVAEIPTEDFSACDLISFSEANWKPLPHILSGELTPDTDEPDEVRTSQTAGLKIEPCPGSTSFSLEVEAVLCCSDWLWCYLFPLRVPECGAGGTYLDYSRGLELLFAWNPDITCLDNLEPRLTHFAKGRAEAGGFGFNNNDTAASETSFTIKITAGPWAPYCDSSYTLPPSAPDPLVTAGPKILSNP
jgi:hypothetical protein